MDTTQDSADVARLDRFWAKVVKGDGCWEWQGARDRKGYGVCAIGNRRTATAHRWLYEQTHGELPDHIYVCHHCDNPRCVRPDHLFIGTAKDNAHDAIQKGRFRYGFQNREWATGGRKPSPACMKGHLWTPESTLLWGPKKRRLCRICHNEYRRNRRKRLRAAA